MLNEMVVKLFSEKSLRICTLQCIVYMLVHAHMQCIGTAINSCLIGSAKIKAIPILSGQLKSISSEEMEKG